MEKEQVYKHSNMKVLSLIKVSFALALLLLTFISYTSTTISNVLADSPSFSRQEVGDDEHDGININGVEGTQTRDDYGDPLDNSTDIQKITYLSDGKNLNASLWLSGNFAKDPGSKGAAAAVYGILLDVDSNPNTGFQGVDYQLEVQWMNSSKTWNMFLGEYPSVDNASEKSPADYLKILSSKENYTGFFVDNKPYVTMSLPLNDVAFPSKFKAMYYAIVIYDNSNMIVDLGSWIDIPPLNLAISTLPNPVVIRQGEQKNVAIQLKSDDGFISDVAGFLPLENYSKIDLQPKDMDEFADGEPPQTSTDPTTFIMRVSSDAEIGEYTIPMLVNISTAALFPSEFLRLSNFTFSVPTKGNVLRVANFTLSVIEPITIQDQIKEFWAAYGGIITLIGAGFGGGLASYVLDRAKNRKSNRNNKERTE